MKKIKPNKKKHKKSFVSKKSAQSAIHAVESRTFNEAISPSVLIDAIVAEASNQRTDELMCQGTPLGQERCRVD
jgi:hypothetical protein